MRNKLFISILLFCSFKLSAQQNLIFRGNIKYDRSMNIHKQIDEMASMGGNATFMEQMKKRVEKYKTDHFEMEFNTQQSIYKPAKDGIMDIKMMWGSAPAEKNEVYNDYANKKSVAKKEIYDQQMLIEDSLKKFTWKIKSEYRTIAGYNCRRAETIIMDSVWVIAFYADEIIAPGGPEGFNGLPGMILGVVIPRLNVTYFATEVSPFLEDKQNIVAPEKGKAKVYDNAGLEKMLRDNIKQWGQWVNRVLWYTTI